jgi:hypothetical protein
MINTTVKMVEVEIHSLCNRRCRWCPNCMIDRSKKILLDETAYLNTLTDLRLYFNIGYLSFSRYNEPFADPPLFHERLLQAKTILPEVKTICNTNGDFLSDFLLGSMMLDELTIMDYDNVGTGVCLDRLNEWGCTVLSVNYPFIRAERPGMQILYYVDWPQNVTLYNRGGFFRRVAADCETDFSARTAPCLDPSVFIGIDHTGDVTPCCNIRGDVSIHKPHILGNILNEPLHEIFLKHSSILFRDILYYGDYQMYPLPCRNCQKGQGRYTRENPGIDY